MGTVVATIKRPQFEGAKLLLVQPETPQGEARGATLLAIDSVGAGVNEIRARDASGAYRVIYLATRPEAVYVLHCFQKKTEKTSQHDHCRPN